jgi:hypothetical protein
MPWRKGEPGGLAELDDNGIVPNSQLAKGQPGGVAPLGTDNLVPEIHLPPFNIDIEQIVNVINGGIGLQFLEQISPFHEGVYVSTIIHDGAYGNGVHVLVGEAGIGYSRNNTEWTLVATQPFSVAAVGIAFGVDDSNKNVFVAIDTENNCSLSNNGMNWNYVHSFGGSYDFEAIAYYNRLFVILCSDGEVLRVTVTGQTLSWFEQEDSPNITAKCNDIEGGNNIYVVVGNNGKICTSEDASHFVTAESPTTNDLLTIAFGRGTFLIGGANNTLIKGTTGTNFERITSPFVNNSVSITGIGYDADSGIFIVTTSDGQVATTTDLINWTEHKPKPTITRTKAIVAGNKHIVLGDDFGNIFASRIAIEVNYPGVSDHYAKKEYVDEKFNEAKNIATGAKTGIAFDTTEQFLSWLAGIYIRPDGKTPDDLNTGESIYIKATEEPDYWWDGETYQEQETKTLINLDDYATLDYVDDKISSIDLGDAKNTWVGGNIWETSANTVSVQLLNASGLPEGGRLDNIKLLYESSGESGGGGSGGDTVIAGGGFVRVYIDATNGNDNNLGDAASTAFQTWERVQAAIYDTASAEIVILSDLDRLTLSNCPNVSIIIPNTIDIENGLKIENSNVRLKGNINLLTYYKHIEIDNSNVVFNGMITAESTNENMVAMFLDTKGISVVRFKEFVIDDTGLNNGTIYYNIETGSEVYVAGYAKHPNPYITDVPDPNIYIFPIGS